MRYFISLLVVFIPFSIANGVGDPTVATVNGKKITKSIFDMQFNQNMLFVSEKRVTKEKVIFDLINRQLGIERAKKNKLFNDETVKRKMEDVLYHAQISKDLEPKLKKIVVTDSDVKKYYKGHKEYRTAHILFRVRVESTKEEVTQALKKSMDLYKITKAKPDKFSEIANKFSQTAAAPNGGDIGYQPSIRLAPEYFEAISGKDIGYITSPVRSQFGYHVIKVLGVKDIKNINTGLYKKIVYDQKRDVILNQYFANLRKAASIKIVKTFLE
jgi:parvulin-like peptidyl-prolyl isomerase